MVDAVSNIAHTCMHQLLSTQTNNHGHIVPPCTATHIPVKSITNSLAIACSYQAYMHTYT